MFLVGALIMCFNLYMTAKGRVRKSERRADDVSPDVAAVPAE
jgi:cytochrome c oxidase cbb3-type subunit I